MGPVGGKKGTDREKSVAETTQENKVGTKTWLSAANQY